MSSEIIKHTAQQDCERVSSQSFNTLLADVRQIIENGRKQAYNAVEQAGIATFWNVGRRIVVELQHGETRAEYGTHLIKNLAEAIVPLYGKHIVREIFYYKKFYLTFPDLEIVNTRVHNLDWSHFRRVLSVVNPDARLWYLENASKNMCRYVNLTAIYLLNILNAV